MRSSDKTIVLPLPVNTPSCVVINIVLFNKCKVLTCHNIVPVVLINLCLIFSPQQVVKDKVKSDNSKEAQPGRGAQSTLRKEVGVV